MEKKRLFGSWILIEHSQIESDLKGNLSYLADGRMSVQITGKNQGRDIEIIYSGLFFIEGNYVVHHIEKSNNPDRIGTQQKRYIEFNDNLMIFTDGLISPQFKIVWQKI